MSEYVVMRSLPSIEGDPALGYMEIEDWDSFDGFDDWGSGTLARSEPANSVEIRAVPHGGYAGMPDDFQDMNVPLMSKRLKEAVESAGVDNIYFRPVVVRNSDTGEAYEYFAFNLVGLVGAVELARSSLASHDGDFVGDSQIYDLAVEPSRTRGLLMFRLKEKFSVILIHRRVRDAIERAGIATVKFVDPANFMAL